MATITAFIRSASNKKKATIRFRVRDGRDKQFFYKSKVQIEPALWDSKKQRVKSKVVCDEVMRNTINNDIAKITKAIEEVYSSIRFEADLDSIKIQEAIDHHLYPSLSAVKGDSLVSLLEVFIQQKRFSEWRKKAYYVIVRSLQRYELANSTILYVNSFSQNSIRDFERFLENEYLGDTDLFKGTNSRKPKPRSRNTINGVLAKLRTFFIWANKNGYTDNNPFANYTIEESVYGTPIYISIDERNKLYHTKMPTESLERVRDIFVFQCLIGCRVGDLIRLTTDNLINNAIEYIPRKTKEGQPLTVRVPLNKIANEIIAKYSSSNTKELLPFISEQKYNVYIKECFKYAELTRIVTVLNPLTRQPEHKPINKVASSHMARRTFIGNLYKQVQDPNLICALSGHKEGSKAFTRYRDIDEDMKCQLVSLLE